MVDHDKLRQATDEYVRRINEITAFYHDSHAGLEQLIERVQSLQADFIDQNRETNPALASEDYLDSTLFIYGVGDPNEPDHVVQYSSTQGELKVRNKRGGINFQLVARFCVVLIYEYWESEYRSRIASALGLAETKELTEPIMGDLRLLRNDILHNQAVATAGTTRRLEVVTGLSDGDPIVFPERVFDSIARAVKTYLDQLVTDATGADPAYRLVWRVG